MRIARHTLLSTLGVLVLLSGCSESQQNTALKIDYGSVEGSTYKNEYLEFTIQLPEDWQLQSQDTNQQLTELGTKIFSGDDGTLKAAVEASQLSSVTLFSLFEHALGAPVEYNPNVICVAEKLSLAPGIKTGEDYLFHTKNILKSGQLDISFPQPITTQSLGGREYGLLRTDMDLIGMSINQQYYTIVSKGYALSFIISYTNDEEEASLLEILSTLSHQ